MVKAKSFREEFSRYRLKKVPGLYGIEIETEVKDHTCYPNGFLKQYEDDDGNIRFKLPSDLWVGHLDNSLRHYGIEYVSAEPLSYTDTMLSLNTFGEMTKGIPFIKGTPSTSVHVHVNMLNESLLTFANFLILYTFFESVLVDFSGETRKSNLFALPIRVAEVTLDNIEDMIVGINKGQDKAIKFNPNNVKYAALNLAPLTTFGSLEIRCFRGETDVSAIKEWVTIINKLVEFSRIPGLTPRDVLKSFRDKGVAEFFSSVFQEMAEVIRSKVPEVDFLIEKNLYAAAWLSSLVPDWGSFHNSISRHKDNEEVNFPYRISLDDNDNVQFWQDISASNPGVYELVVDWETSHLVVNLVKKSPSPSAELGVIGGHAVLHEYTLPTNVNTPVSGSSIGSVIVDDVNSELIDISF